MIRKQYPIQEILPFQKDGHAGFELKFDLQNGKTARVTLRDDRPSWVRIKPLEKDADPSILIAAFNHELLPIRTLDVEIEAIYLPASNSSTT